MITTTAGVTKVDSVTINGSGTVTISTGLPDYFERLERTYRDMAKVNPDVLGLESVHSPHFRVPERYRSRGKILKKSAIREAKRDEIHRRGELLAKGYSIIIREAQGRAEGALDA